MLYNLKIKKNKIYVKILSKIKKKIIKKYKKK